MQINKCYYCMGDMAFGEEVCPHCGKKKGEIPQPEYAIQPGMILHGKYLIGAVLGQGGFGITYLGYDLLLGIKVAVKEYYPSNMAARSRRGTVLWSVNGIPKEEGCSSFLKEARKMAKLMEIPEIVRVLDILLENDTAYIIMDFVEGVTLKGRLKKNGLMSVREVVELLGPVSGALDLVHEHDIIHRDISPDNIMVDRKGKARLLDLGAAKEMDMRSDRDRQSSQLIHKDGFSPPEQYTAGGKIGPWTDVYAMCATVYYCIAGRVIPSAMDRLYDGTAIDFSPSVSQPVRSVLEKGLAMKIQDRYQTMGELWNALRKTVSGPIPKSPDPPKPPTPPEPRGLFKRLSLPLGIAAAAIAIGGTVFAINWKTNHAAVESDTASARETPAAASGTVAGETGYSVFRLANSSVGDIVAFGNYEQDNDESDGKEVIQWVVLDIEDEKALLISRYLLDGRQYNTERADVTWETCTLRKWLNEDFLFAAFTEEELSRIQETIVTADENPDFSVNQGSDTEDRIFLLSIAEARKYFADNECAGTAYAIGNGLNANDAFTLNGVSTSWWWLRSIGCDQKDAAVVACDGVIDDFGYLVHENGGGVRPALWLNLD